MKKIMLLALAVVMSASVASAQLPSGGGHIGLYADPAGSECNLVPGLYITFNIYVIHTLAPEANTSEWILVKTGNWASLLAGAPIWNGLTLGDPYVSFIITYGGCKALPYLVGTLPFTPLALPAACALSMHVAASPAVASGSVEAVDCQATKRLATGGMLTLNGNSTCPCEIATEETNWSRIKALYQ